MAADVKKYEVYITKCQATIRGMIARQRLRSGAVKVLNMDPGQDLDDEMFMVMMRALIDRGLLKCVGIVTALAPADMRAQLTLVGHCVSWGYTAFL